MLFTLDDLVRFLSWFTQHHLSCYTIIFIPLPSFKQHSSINLYFKVIISTYRYNTSNTISNTTTITSTNISNTITIHPSPQLPLHQRHLLHCTSNSSTRRPKMLLKSSRPWSMATRHNLRSFETWCPNPWADQPTFPSRIKDTAFNTRRTLTNSWSWPGRTTFPTSI